MKIFSTLTNEEKLCPVGNKAMKHICEGFTTLELETTIINELKLIKKVIVSNLIICL